MNKKKMEFNNVSVFIQEYAIVLSKILEYLQPGTAASSVF